MLVLDVVSTSFGMFVGGVIAFFLKEEIMDKCTKIAMYLEQKFNQIKGSVKL
ncbi:hypothetical protein [Apilactobacillus xinyiensis]|uniref:hypothetical protein n=1 Tax=Apilactobacillus xinyiensis TaxID=2841032 RepID=UPI00200D0D9E|nr:hypothetical protein [Apilactobacillus xinyiensis]MCL0330658.1 hypothetical protein [Apilactobacillus xinyiensis]